MAAPVVQVREHDLESDQCEHEARRAPPAQADHDNREQEQRERARGPRERGEQREDPRASRQEGEQRERDAEHERVRARERVQAPDDGEAERGGRPLHQACERDGRDCERKRGEQLDPDDGRERVVEPRVRDEDVAARVPVVVPGHESFAAEEVTLVDVGRGVRARRPEPEERGADRAGERAEDDGVPPRERQSRSAATDYDLAGQAENLTRAASRSGSGRLPRSETDTPRVQDSGHASPRRLTPGLGPCPVHP